MPNWCFNRLEINCDADTARDQLADFLKTAKGEDTDLSLDNFVPSPRR